MDTVRAPRNILKDSPERVLDSSVLRKRKKKPDGLGGVGHIVTCPKFQPRDETQNPLKNSRKIAEIIN
jgi:hypothetical protein